MTVRATYTSDELKVYPALALQPVKGETYELPELPADGCWTPEAPAAEPAPTPAPAAAAEPAAAAPAPVPAPEQPAPAAAATPEV